MHLHTAHRARRRVALMAAGAVALSLSACGTFGPQEEEGSSSSHAPVETTSTTEPTSSTTSATSGEPRPEPPDGGTLLTRAKEHMSVMSTVTIDGTQAMEREGNKASIPMTLHSEGSTGGGSSQGKNAGASRTTLTIDNGGKLEVHMQGWYHYVRANDAWFERLGTDETQMAKYAGQWIKIPYDDSPVEDLSPNRLLNGTFFGDSLTQIDVADASGATDRLNGDWVGRLQIASGDKGQEVSRTLWVSLDPDKPEVLKLTAGKDKSRATYRFSKWNETDDDLTPPKGAKALKKDMLKGIRGT